MYFCPYCSYILDIAKSSITQKSDKININKIPELFKILENNDNLNNYKINIPIEELESNKKFSKLSADKKKIILKLYDNMSISTNAEFKCTNCNYTNQILETVLLYNINYDDLNIKIPSLEENELFCKDPLLPHTHDYICKNPNCITHKNNELKDSVFYKEKSSYKVKYICCICFYNW